MESETYLRYEYKYLISREQAEMFMKEAQLHLVPDLYAEYDLHNIYFDTERNDMIIHCLEKPVYKEKLRLRSYGNPYGSSPCYLEIKKKFQSFGNKRRIALSQKEADAFLNGEIIWGKNQIGDEIRNLVQRYDVVPQIFLGYHRHAYAGIEEKDLRVTIDENLVYRDDDLNLSVTGDEKHIIDQDLRILEIKVLHSMPLWLVQILTQMQIRRTSFSKYGSVYRLQQKEKEMKKCLYHC